MNDPGGEFGVRRFTLGEVAVLVGADLLVASSSGRLVTGVATLEQATATDLGFLDNRKYVAAMQESRAGACLMRGDHARLAPPSMAVLTTPMPYLAWAKAVVAFHPRTPATPGIDPGAHVGVGARLGAGCRVEPGAVVETGATVGDRCHIGPNATIGRDVVVGDDVRIGAGVYLGHCRLGSGCSIYPGARIGSEGFGFALDGAARVRIPHLGLVVIGDDVDIGANTTIDRGTVGDTVIGSGTMIDNLVQIAHNVVIGRGCVIAGQVGIAGSARIGDLVVIGGQAGIAGHLTVGSRAMIAARSAVKGDLAAEGTYAGAPAVPIGEWRRQIAATLRLGKRKSLQS